MGKLIKKLMFVIIVISFVRCENTPVINKESQQDSLADSNFSLKKEERTYLMQKQVDSIIALFNSMPVLEFNNSLSNGLIKKEKRGKLIYTNNSWEVLYEEDLLESSDAYEHATVDLNNMSISYAFSTDIYQVMFFYSSKSRKRIALTVLSENYTSGTPSDILFIHEIDDQNRWTEVSHNLLNKEKIVERFMSNRQNKDVFNDLFNIKIAHPTRLTFTPNFYYLKNLDSTSYSVHPFFQIDKSKLKDSVVCVWDDSQDKFEIK
jgi:hypothetical protein